MPEAAPCNPVVGVTKRFVRPNLKFQNGSLLPPKLRTLLAKISVCIPRDCFQNSSLESAVHLEPEKTRSDSLDSQLFGASEPWRRDSRGRGATPSPPPSRSCLKTRIILGPSRYAGRARRTVRLRRELSVQEPSEDTANL